MDISLTELRLQEFIGPYVQRTATVASGAGRDLWRATRRNLLKNAIREYARHLAGRPRHRASGAVAQIYQASYSDGMEPLELSLDPAAVARPFLLEPEKLVYMPPVGLFAAYLGAVGDAIAQLRPTSVCEVGFGSGKNLLYLANRFPDIQFSGYELTAAGVGLARHMQQLASLPPNIARLVGFGAKQENDCVQRIDFRQGNAAALPAADGGTDVTVTVLALEQMFSIMPQALAEIRRITRKQVIFIEPFLDTNDWLGRMHLRSRDYLQMATPDLVAAGFRPRAVIRGLPQKLTFRAPMIVADVV